jgi:hypothetical protein
MSFVIGVKISDLPNGYEPILDYYNSKRDQSTPPLEKLPRCEGGFMIKFENYDEIKDFEINNKIQQLRWCKRQLISDIYIGFNDTQLELLYEALVCSLGENNVYKYDKCTKKEPTVKKIFHVKYDGDKLIQIK